MSIGLTQSHTNNSVANRSHPCLTPMSEIAVRLMFKNANIGDTLRRSISFLVEYRVKRGKVVILGGGVVGFNA